MIKYSFLLILGLILSIISFGQSEHSLSQRSTKTTGQSLKSFDAPSVKHGDRTAEDWVVLEVPEFEHTTMLERMGPSGNVRVLGAQLGKSNKQEIGTELMVLDFLNSHLPSVGIAKPSEELALVSQEKDDLGYTHLKYERSIEGLRVFGAEIVVDVSPDSYTEARGEFFETPASSEEEIISENSAIQIGEKVNSAHAQMHANDSRWQFSLAKGIQSELVWYPMPKGNLVKAYILDIHPNYLEWIRVIVHASSGEIIKKYEKTCTIDGPKTASAQDLNGESRSLNTYQVGSTYYLIDASKSMFKSSRSNLPDNPVGGIWTIDAENSDGSSYRHVTSSNNTWNDKSSVSAHYHAGLAFDYFKNTHGRNSINGSGGSIISMVNVTDENGTAFDNAYWNGKAMFYGNGRVAFTPLAGSLDVAGHEMTHGVVGSTANLEYYSQSGAINESMADVFGAMMDRDDWQLGEDIVKKTVFRSGALRDLSDPHNGGTNLNHNGYQPMKMSEYYTGDDDNQGVHINSGIPNHAYYLIADEIGKDKAENIYYRTLVRYLTSSSDFLDLRYAVVKAASDIHGASSAEVKRVKEAFDEVEIFDPNQGSGDGGGNGDTTELPENTGAEFILSLDVDFTNTNTLYKSSVSGTNFQAMSTTKFNRKPSVLDNGTSCYFVSTSNEIRKIDIKGTVKESVISPDLIWDNVAISKDGKRLAAITTDVDSAIYVYDFDSQKWRVFQLYNPTYSEGVRTGGVLYADALEFDHTGQFVLYDARNLIRNNTGADIDYWDIGIIKVWNIQEDTWGDGKVEKLYNQLPKDVSIGNPTYSSNSPHIIAFDYIDTHLDEYAVLAKNTASGTTGTIITNDRLSYPDYSTDDEKMLFDAETNGGTEVVGVVEIGEDKISGTSTPVALIGDAKWGVWYAEGNRKLLSSENELITFAFPAVQGAPVADITGTTAKIKLPDGTDASMLIPTFTLSDFAYAEVKGVEQISGVSGGNYTADVKFDVTAQDGSTTSYIIKTEIEVSTGIGDEHKEIWVVYPNPTSGILHVSGSSRVQRIGLYDLSGRQVMEEIGVDLQGLDLSALGQGFYHLVISTENSEIHRRISKQ